MFTLLETAKKAKLKFYNAATIELLEAEGKKGLVWRLAVIKTGWSKNGKFYPAEVLEAAVPRFEGATVNAFKFSGEFHNHLPSGTSEQNPAGFALNVEGWLEDAKFESLESYGLEGHGITALFNVTDPKLAETLRSAWEKGKKDLLGFSIDAEGKMARGDAEGLSGLIVTSIDKVNSLDVVSQPAAGGQLLRIVASLDNPIKKENTMLRRLIESLLREFGDGKGLIEFLKSEKSNVLTKESVEGKQDAEILEALVTAFESGVDGSKFKDVRVTSKVIESLSGLIKDGKFGESIDAIKGYLKETAEGDPAPAVPADPVKPAEPVVPAVAPVVDPVKPADPVAPVVPAVKADDSAVKEALNKLLVESSDNKAKARILEAKLPEPTQNKVLRQLVGTGKVIETSLVESTIKEEKIALDGLKEKGILTFSGGPIEMGRNKSDKHGLAMDKMLGDLDETELKESQGIPAFEGLKHAYIEMTGDVGITGLVDRGKLREADSSDFPFALGNTLNRRMVRDYSKLAKEWQKLVGETNVKDFREQEVVRWGGFNNLATVAEDGPYTAFTTPSEEEAKYTPLTKGRSFYITRRMVINDDIQSVQKFPKMAAIAADRTLAQFVWNLILSYTSGINDTAIYDAVVLYHAGSHNNTATDALATAPLSVARIAMMNQTEADSGEILGIRPKYLIVPPNLEPTARYLVESDHNPGSVNHDMNIHKGQYEIIMSPYLQSDLNNWYLMADKNDIEGVEIGYVQGRRDPELFLQDQPTVGATFTNDRLTWKIRHEYGGAVIDYRGFYGAIVT